MDSINKLCIRNAELETELRLVQDQLARAHSATAYLATTFAQQQTNNHHVQLATLQTRLDEAKAKNAHLVACLRGTTGEVKRIPETSTSESSSCTRPTLAFSSLPRAFQPNILPSLLDTDEERTEPDASDSEENIDLLSFEESEHVTFQNAKRKSTFSALSNAPKGTPFTSSSNAVDTQALLCPDQFAVPTAEEAEQNGYTIQLSDGSTTFVTLTPSSSYQPQSFQNSPSTYRGWRVPPHERTRILNAACFIEDYDREQWEEFAEMRARYMYTVEEWQRYYEEMVRPEYLRRVARKTMAADEIDAVANTAQAPTGRANATPSSDGEPSGSVKTSLAEAGLVNTATELPTPGTEFATVQGMHASSVDAVAEDIPNQGHATERLDEAATATVAQGLEHVLATSNHARVPTYEILECEPVQHINAIPAKLNLDHLEVLGGSVVSQADKPDDLECQAQPDITARPSAVADYNDVCRPESTSFNPSEQPAARYAPRRGSESHISVHPSANQVCALDGARPSLSNGDKMALFSQPLPNDDRTVLIAGIPPNISLVEVLDQVRGGPIISSIYLCTAGMRTIPPIEMNSVLVTFLHSSNAKQYVEYCTTKCCLSFWSTEWEAPFKATASHIDTSCSPIPRWFRPWMSRTVFLADNGQCNPAVLTLTWGANKEGVPKIPLRMERTADGLLQFEFASVSEAIDAERLLRRPGVHNLGMRAGFADDSCARAVEELMERMPIHTYGLAEQHGENATRPLYSPALEHESLEDVQIASEVTISRARPEVVDLSVVSLLEETF